MRRLALGLTLGVLLAGCGDDDAAPTPTGGGDRAEVEAAFRTYLDRLAERDGDGACAAMAPSLREKMLAAMRAAGAGELVKGRSCGEVLDFIAEQNPDYAKATQNLDDAELSNLRIAGDRATYDWTITVSGTTVENKGEATRVGGRWLISCCVPGQ